MSSRDGSAGEDPVADTGPPPVRGVLPYPLKRLGPARQVVIVVSRSWTGTQARLEAWEEGANGWQLALGPVPARLGRTGMVAQERCLARSGATPAGTFPLTLAFGLRPDPGTRMPYVHVTSEDEWWVGDPVSPHYNGLRSAAQQGFRPTENGSRGSKRIAGHPERYGYAVVVDFNRPYPDRSLSWGIFLRVSTGLSTDGSVAIDEGDLEGLLRWLDPACDPVVTIAPERVIAQY